MTQRATLSLEILCPGLLISVPADWVPETSNLSSLERMLSRAVVQPEYSDDIARNLGHRFGVEPVRHEDFPEAALALLGMSIDPGGGYWLRADPVCLQADRDELVLQAMPADALTREEATAFVSRFNDHFESEGWQLVAPQQHLWYLRAPRPLAVQTSRLDAVLGRGIGDYLPRGDDAGVLRRLLTEAEMLLHEMMRGFDGSADLSSLPNSLWLSGGGTVPLVPPRGWDAVRGDDPLLRGLAVAGGKLPGDAAEPLPATGRTLFYSDVMINALRAGDRTAFEAGLRLVATRVAEGVAMLRTGAIRRLRVSDGVSRVWETGRRRRWWRPVRPYHVLSG